MNKKVALITGSTSGIGLAIAKELLNKTDFQVIISGRTQENIEEAIKDLSENSSRITSVVLDVSDKSSVDSAFQKIKEKYGRLDFLFNNAGINPYFDENEASTLTVTAETLQKTFNINALGALLTAQKAIELMKQHDFGRIINTSTEMASLNSIQRDYYPLAPSYRISKVALNAITSLLAREVSGTGITVNSYSPGWTQTKIGGEQAPFTPEEASETAIFIATNEEFKPNGKFFAEIRKFGGPIELNW